MTYQLMPEGFVPKGRGRPPKYDISELLIQAKANPGRWFEQILSKTDAQSAKRQADKIYGASSALRTLADGQVAFYLKWVSLT